MYSFSFIAFVVCTLVVSGLLALMMKAKKPEEIGICAAVSAALVGLQFGSSMAGKALAPFVQSVISAPEWFSAMLPSGLSISMYVIAVVGLFWLVKMGARGLEARDVRSVER